MDSSPLFPRDHSKPSVANLLRILSDREAHNLFLLNACLERKGRCKGSDFHKILGEWLHTGFCAQQDLVDWIGEQEWFRHHSIRDLDLARLEADSCIRKGNWVAVWRESSKGLQLFPNCPRVLFGFGSRDWEKQHIAVFNSRKPKSVQPDATWLCYLRNILNSLAQRDLGFAGSVGTLTYDLVTAWASAKTRPLLLVSPYPVEEMKRMRTSLGTGDEYHDITLACTTRRVLCAKATRMTCRDRLLAALADFHLIAEIRSGGNLLRILEDQQSTCSRAQWMFMPDCRSKSNEGNFILLEKFPGSVQGVSPERSCKNGTDARIISKCVDGYNEFPEQELEWGQFLYHYTRSCPGPWPGQSHREYLLDLLAGKPWAGHTALHTLSRILQEGRIRASGRLVREGRAVVSLSVRPPRDIACMRKWNPALIRWTFEPYGIAIRRRVVKKLGARPVIYLKNDQFEAIPDSERFRFQRHALPDCVWKQEREWRIPTDLLLHDITPGEAFIFVATPKDRVAIETTLSPGFPIIVLPPMSL